MKFGLFYEISVPRPWTRESERTVYQTALEQGNVLHEWKLGRIRHFQPGLALVDITELDVETAGPDSAGPASPGS